jgi:hypothetical protein
MRPAWDTVHSESGGGVKPEQDYARLTEEMCEALRMARSYVFDVADGFAFTPDEHLNRVRARATLMAIDAALAKVDGYE